MMDLIVLAFRTDMTRVVSFQLARELSTRSYPEIGVPEAHHDISHHGNQPENVAGKSKIDQYHMLLLSHLVGQMGLDTRGRRVTPRLIRSCCSAVALAMATVTVVTICPMCWWAPALARSRQAAMFGHRSMPRS